MAGASGLERQAMEDQWKRVKELMADEFTTTVALGYLDADRVQETYDLVETYFAVLSGCALARYSGAWTIVPHGQA